MSEVTIQTVATDFYVEPISGKKFKKWEAALKHGLKMQKEKDRRAMQDARIARWRATVESHQNVVECLKIAVESQIEEWCIQWGLATNAIKPEWVSAEVLTFSLVEDTVAAKVKLEIRIDVWRSFKEPVYFKLENLLGEDYSAGSVVFGAGLPGEGGRSYCGMNRMSSRFVREDPNVKSYSINREITCFELKLRLKLSQYPLLATRVAKDVVLVSGERARQTELTQQVRDAIQSSCLHEQADAELRALRKRLRELEQQVKALEKGIEASVRSAPESMAGQAAWDEYKGAAVPAAELSRLVKMENYAFHQVGKSGV